MKKWTLIHKGKPELTREAEHFNISPEISQILKNRNINSEEEIKLFTNPTLDYLRDPFLMKDMKKAVDKIKEAVSDNKSIWIYGDYDVDGVSSTSVLLTYFKSIGYKVKYYIPNRLEEGYGINKEAIEYINKEGCDLMISVDCGITSVEEVEYANKLGITVIITDHHECQSEIPNAYAVINPKQDDCNYPFDMLCGCGIAFKLVQALTPKEEFKNTVNDYIEITTLATICDIVPLVDENRIIVKNGLKTMKSGKNTGLSELIKVCGVDKEKIGSSHIGFTIGPRINAAGRLGFSNLGVELFIEDDKEKAHEIALLLDEKNNDRQMIEMKIHHEAETIIKSDKSYQDDKVIVLAHEGWQHGVIGIVASKLTEKYYKPTILMCIEDGQATGSARSIKGFSIFEALNNCSDILTKFGGHEQAAGLSIKEENIEELRKRINESADVNLSEEDMIEEIKVEYELDENVVDFDLIEQLRKLEPFGMNNPTPKFIIRDCILRDMRLMGQNKQHIKIDIEKDNRYECVGFNASHLIEGLKVGDKIDILFQLDENTFMGNRKIQLLIKDIRLSHPKSTTKNIEAIKLMNKLVPSDENELYKISDIDTGLENVNISGKKEENIFEYLKEETLVIANSINGFFRAKSDVSLLDEDVDISFRKIEDNKKHSKINLIFAPNIDKIDLKRYNNIILYDYLYTKEDYVNLYANKENECKVIKNYSEIDKIYIKSIMENIIPNRNEFVVVYKYILKNKEIRFRIDDIMGIFKIIPLKMFTIFKVFKELDLIDMEIDEREFLRIEVLPKPEKKLDLNSSKILKNLNQIKEKAIEIYNY
ncbi:single-stranded-DNA-specific exonuclease RecJ [Peptacetobacter sp.]|uniref:single-stranded-DNA-specific exonuclease RecJ n=1 Tax=Peptacetobacter sp. TaxID=2991975 RepID=UPI002639E1CC|nr:single-stranded-DNA-specific exonuclease RecJ [Peptacetobacter sp.]